VAGPLCGVRRSNYRRRSGLRSRRGLGLKAEPSHELTWTLLGYSQPVAVAVHCERRYCRRLQAHAVGEDEMRTYRSLSPWPASSGSRAATRRDGTSVGGGACLLEYHTGRRHRRWCDWP
jgi:hypothetical protein